MQQMQQQQRDAQIALQAAERKAVYFTPPPVVGVGPLLGGIRENGGGSTGRGEAKKRWSFI